jgi:tRNA(Ile)-lysidine synthase
VQRVAVAVSGGRDSTALLHCTAKAAAGLGLEVLALHVHHGLNPQADLWLEHVRRQCKRWHVALDWRRLPTLPTPGQSVEAWARRERYAALQLMAQTGGCGLVLLAHHRRDQAETWLLQALRSAGPAGLSAMPRRVLDEGVVWARPWLDQPRQAIEAYVRRHHLKHIEDSSNIDPRFARNRLRSQVWPALVQAFPDAEVALCGAAARAQEAQALANEVATIDLPTAMQGAALLVPAWLALPPARRLNVLRAWLLQSLGRGSPQSLLDRLNRELPSHRTGRWDAPGAVLRLYRNLLTALPAMPASLVVADDLVPVDLSRAGEVYLSAWQGSFVSSPNPTGGLPIATLKTAVAGPRRGGEQFQFVSNTTPRSLKKQYQARGVPAWQREGPLLFSAQGELLYVPGLGINASAQAAPAEPQLQVQWHSSR